MPETPRPSPLVRAVDKNDDKWQTFAHPLNPRSEIHGLSLSEMAGMQRVGVHLVKVPPGKEAFIYHTHTTEEEFIYILSGRGVAEIDGIRHEVGPGDFMGFPTPSAAHHLTNPFDDDLVYLMGGERREVEIADFPRIGKRILRTAGEAHIADLKHVKPFWKRAEDE